MSAAKGRVSIAEVMGTAGGNAASGGQRLQLSDLPALLGDKMPKLPVSHVGRRRLVKALQVRFGDGYRNLPGITELIDDFDKEIEHNLNVIRMRNLMKGR